MFSGRGALVLNKTFFYAQHNHRTEAAALRKTKKEWEACGTVVTSLCTTMYAAMDEVDARVKQVRVPRRFSVLAG